MSRSRRHQRRRRSLFVTAWEARWRDRRDDIATGVRRTRIPSPTVRNVRAKRIASAVASWERRTIADNPYPAVRRRAYLAGTSFEMTFDVDDVGGVVRYTTLTMPGIKYSASSKGC